MRGGLFWLNDRQWARIERHLPTGLKGPEREDDRRIISGIIHMLQSGARWRDCPREYGPYTTVYNRFNRWSKAGRWRAIFEALAKPGKDAVVLSLDSTSIKAHRCEMLVAHAPVRSRTEIIQSYNLGEPLAVQGDDDGRCLSGRRGVGCRRRRSRLRCRSKARPSLSLHASGPFYWCCL